MRYRHVEQAFFVFPAGAVGCVIGGLRRPRLLCRGVDEGFAVFGDAVDGMDELAHGCDEGEFWEVSGGAQALVEGLEPRVSGGRQQAEASRGPFAGEHYRGRERGSWWRFASRIV